MNKTTKKVQGPLYAVRTNPNGDPLITDEKDRVIASVWKAEFAPLLAAAPELYAACKAALEEGDDYKAIEQLKAAIAKAEGR